MIWGYTYFRKSPYLYLQILANPGSQTKKSGFCPHWYHHICKDTCKLHLVKKLAPALEMPTGSPPERQRACTWSRSWDLWWPAGSRSKHPGRNPETPGEVHRGIIILLRMNKQIFGYQFWFEATVEGFIFSSSLPASGVLQRWPSHWSLLPGRLPWHRASIRNRSMSRHSSAARSSCSSRRSGLSHHHRPPSSLENWPYASSFVPPVAAPHRLLSEKIANSTGWSLSHSKRLVKWHFRVDTRTFRLDFQRPVGLWKCPRMTPTLKHLGNLMRLRVS